MTERRTARTIGLKLHADLVAHIEAEAEREYCSLTEIIRRLIIADMRNKQVTE